MVKIETTDKSNSPSPSHPFSPSQIRIVVADDHPIFRRGLRQVLETDPHLRIIAEAEDGQTALARIEELKPDVAVLDIDMPAPDGFEIARRDLELRGPGELLGTRQTGLAQMRVADLIRDADLLPKVQAAAQMLESEPRSIAALTGRWIGHGERYGRIG